MEDCKRHLQQLVLAQKAKKFWEDGIMTFAERWRKIVDQNVKYIVQ